MFGMASVGEWIGGLGWNAGLPALIVWASIAFVPVHIEGAEPVPKPKKGVGYWNADGSFIRLSSSVDALRCSWYYNWTTVPDARGAELRAEFIPMIWNAPEASEANFERLSKSGYRTLLGFNEPDRKDQANMKVEKAIELWPRLMRTGMRLGSPAPADGASDKNWLQRFMKEAEAREYRVDFICLHWYGDITAPDAVEVLKDFLESNWKRYRRPIWLTEFSGSTGPWLEIVDPPVTREKNAEFIRKALPMLESLPFLERYAWFELKWNAKPWATVALVNPKNGKLTPAGKAYRNGGR